MLNTKLALANPAPKRLPDSVMVMPFANAIELEGSEKGVEITAALKKRGGGPSPYKEAIAAVTNLVSGKLSLTDARQVADKMNATVGNMLHCMLDAAFLQQGRVLTARRGYWHEASFKVSCTTHLAVEAESRTEVYRYHFSKDRQPIALNGETAADLIRLANTDSYPPGTLFWVWDVANGIRYGSRGTYADVLARTQAEAWKLRGIVDYIRAAS